jgi:hypothetical protein
MRTRKNIFPVKSGDRAVSRPFLNPVEAGKSGSPLSSFGFWVFFGHWTLAISHYFSLLPSHPSRDLSRSTPGCAGQGKVKGSQGVAVFHK